MRSEDQDSWRDAALDVLMAAIATDDKLRAALIFKGARILSARLGTRHRFSRDIDANMTQNFVDVRPEAVEQERALEHLIRTALERFMARADPIRYRMESIRVVRRPPQGHPRGWSAFRVSVRLTDLKNQHVVGIPTLLLDVAAPEPLGDNSVAPLGVGDGNVLAYTLERQTGDKMKAFLTSLPAYRAKLGGGPAERTRRVKDLYDIATVERAHPVNQDRAFWDAVGKEFAIAARGRGVDCAGIVTFAEGLDETRTLYEESEIFGNDIPFDAAWAALERVVGAIERRGLIPFRFALPPRID